MNQLVRRRALSLTAVLAALVILAVAGGAYLFPKAKTAATVGGPFDLVDQDGKTVTEQVLKGQPTLVFFGYTHCPDVCPATLAEISSVFKSLGPDNKARALFVTVDPQRDTPAVLKDYLSSFDPRITGLTGTPNAVKAIESEYKVYAKAVPDKDGTYSMDHTAITYLMDKDGEFVGAFNLDVPVADAATDLRRYF